MRLSLLIIAGYLLFAGCTTQAAEPATNVIVFLADDMGYGDPQCLNHKSKIPTPNIDALSRQGMTFTDAHTSSSICPPVSYGIGTCRSSIKTA